MQVFKNNSGLKDYVEASKTAKTETNKLEVAKKKLADLQTEESKELAKLTVQIQKQTYANKEMAKSTLEEDRKSTRLNSSHSTLSRMPSSA